MGKVPICASYVPSMEMPSFHQDSFAGGLLELESQMMVASMPGRSSSGSMRIFTVSGATAKKTRIKNNARCCQTAGEKPPPPRALLLTVHTQGGGLEERYLGGTVGGLATVLRLVVGYVGQYRYFG